MASYHLSAQVIKRSQGRSAVAAAAYRAGARLEDRRAGVVHDYSQRRGVAHAEIMTPDHAPAWMQNRDKLWNAIEQGEKRGDAQLAREINMALPHELTDEERVALVRGFVGEQFVARGMVADFAIHQPVRENGDDPRNHHAHIMLSLRKASADGFHRVKTREWNSDEMLKGWRESWADWQNRSLGRAGRAERVDHRTLKRQREDAVRAGDRAGAVALDREPEIHVGVRAMKAVERGRHPKSRDRRAGPARQRLRPGEWERTTERVFVDRGAGETSWFKRQFGDRYTAERREYVDRARRLVRYTVIDHGTRFEENLRRIERNLDRYAREIERLQRKLARLRLRRQWYSRADYQRQQHYRQLQFEREQEQRRKLWKRKMDEDALHRAWFKVEHVRKRIGFADSLIRGIDGVVAQLLGIRERGLGRRQGLRTRPQDRQAARALDRGRTRANRPTGPSRPAPRKT